MGKKPEFQQQRGALVAHSARAPGLDGLRGLAVLAVVAFHERFSGLPGGFLGVDVFFVISGYLITDLLAAQWRRCGRVDVRGFWIRRARRLLPCLAVMLVTVTAAVAVTDPDELAGLRPALLAAITYTSNWWQALHQQSYFATFGPPPPLQHLWSLAIEEQFYLLWPLVLMVLLGFRQHRLRQHRLRQRRADQRRAGSLLAAQDQTVRPQTSRSRTAGHWRASAAIAWLGAAVSAVAMAAGYAAGEDPSRLYYGTDTHATALLVGAALAFSWPLWRLTAAPLIHARRFDLAGLVGLSVLAWEMAHLAGGNGVLYAGGFAVAALAAGAVVVAAAATGVFAGMLGWRPLRWIGIRSYGIYLWHWPVIALIAAHAGTHSSSVWIRAAETAVAVTLAAASWRWIEEPIIHDGLRATLRTWRPGVARSIAAARQSPHGAMSALVPVAAFAVLCTAGYGIVWPPGGPSLQQQIAAGATVSAASRAQVSAPHARDATAGLSASFGSRPPDATLPGTAPVGTGPGISGSGISRSESTGSSSAPGAGRAGKDLGKYVTAIGDSVMLASAAQLRAALPGIYIDAQVSRQMSQGIAIVRGLDAAGALRSVVVVGLGTNGAVTTQQVRTLMSLAGPRRILVLVNTFVPRPWQAEVNAVLAGAARHDRDVVLANWFTAIRGRTDLLWADGVHPQPQGAAVYARMVDAAARQAAGRLGQQAPATGPASRPGWRSPERPVA